MLFVELDNEEKYVRIYWWDTTLSLRERNVYEEIISLIFDLKMPKKGLKWSKMTQDVPLQKSYPLSCPQNRKS